MAPEDPKNKAQVEGFIDLSRIPLEEPENGVFEAYSNVVNMNWTLYDVRIRSPSCSKFQMMIVRPGTTSTG